MLIGVVLGFAIGVAAGWLGAPLAGKELRAKATSPQGRRSLADSLKMRDQTIACARQALDSARAQAEAAAEATGETVADVTQSAKETAEHALERPRTLLDNVKQRIEDARQAADEGYQEGVEDARRNYERMREGRDLE